MDLGKGYVNDGLPHLCTYNARTVSTNADLHALLEAAGPINYNVIALQESPGRRT
ncbi:unnamed protein product [Strongylus vulgaris]|uniref:Endonuclease/exonuclease/phosphatase domain-containing protein n=1 Tax=Strongylus vulgaris TaxID=40348 RepID=A0A3P7K3F3_STRVU|nr:unnamed protein product [Strongylus vulgaris]